MNSNNGNSRNDGEFQQQNKQTVVSDALAKNSRQLLYAHLYNYLVENKLYDTAKILLKEADVPLSNPLEKDGNSENEDDDISNHESNGNSSSKNSNLNGDENTNNEDDDALPGVKMLMTSPDTFLLEWWQSLWALHSYVKETPAIHQQQQQQLMSNSFNPYIAAQVQAQAQAQAQSINQGNNQFMPPPPPSASAPNSVIPKSTNSPIDPAFSNNNLPSPASQVQQQQQQKTGGPTPQQALQSPLPQSAHGTPHPSSNITAPSPAPNSNMIPMQQIPPQQQQLQQQPPGSAGPTPQMHHRTPIPQQQQQPQQQPLSATQPQPPGGGPLQQQPQQVRQPPQGATAQQQQQQRQPPNQWQFNKMHQQLQAQELQQRVQMQKMQLNNQFNFQNLPPQQQQQFFLQQQQRLQAAQAAQAQAAQAAQMAQAQATGRPIPQQQIPQQAQFQQQFPPNQIPIQQPQQHTGGQMGSNVGTPTTQHPPQRPKPQQQQQQQPPQQATNDPGNGLRGDNSTALHDYQMQLMMLENQTKHVPQQGGMQGIGAGLQQQIGGAGASNQLNKSKSRGESVGIDPLQPAGDPIINQQFMDLFNNPNDLNNGGNPNGSGQWPMRNGSSGNLGIDELNVDLGVGFPNGNFMNGF